MPALATSVNRDATLRRLAVAAAAFIAVAVLALDRSDALHRLNLALLDIVLATLRTPETTTAPVTLVAIDDASLAEIGPWPWPRARQAELITALADARAVGYDVAMVDPWPEASDDDAVSSALATHGRVVLPIVFAAAGQGLVEVPPLPAFASAAAGLGHVALPTDTDGVLRGVALWSGLTNPPLPAFAVELLAVGGLLDDDLLCAACEQQAGVDLPPAYATRHVPLAHLPPIQRISAADVLAERVDAEQWTDRVVVLGVTAVGNTDLHYVSDGAQARVVSGTEVQAQLVEALALGLVLRPLAPSDRLMISGLLLLTLLVIYSRATHAVILLYLGIVAPVGLALLLAHFAGLWLAPSAVILGATGLVSIRTVEQLWLARRAARRERERAKAILNAIDTAVLSTDASDRVRFSNTAARRLLGPGADASDVLATGLLHGAGLGGLAEARAHWQGEARSPPAAYGFASRGGRPQVVELGAVDGSVRAVQLSCHRVPASDEAGIEEVTVMTDVTELRRLQRELERLASVDLVTNLANRQFVTQHLPQAVARARRDGSELAVLVIDLDHFKEVNDRFGHQAGDLLLAAAAQRIRAACRADDLVARTGGDEFVVVMAGLEHRHHAALLAQKLLDAFSEALRFDGRELVVGLSIGVSCLSDQAGDGDALLGRADLAMYRAKRERSAFCLFSPALDAAARRELELREELRAAVGAQSFALAFQPKVAIRTGEPLGFEALLRWRRHDGQPVSPAEFIPIAENAGLMPAITDWVIANAVREIERWRAAYGVDISVAVNVSARYFLDPRLLMVTTQALAASSFPADRLVIEITESMLMANPDRAIDQMRRLKAIGCTLAIDDFGTGYSSLAYLRDFPIDQIKIDKAFCGRIGQTERDDLIVTAITRMAQSLRIDIVAEGVETSEQAHFLTSLGVNEAQGFFYSRPLDQGDVERWFAERVPRTSRARLLKLP